MIVGLTLVALVYAPALVLLCRAEGVGNLFAPPVRVARGLARAWLPCAASYLVLVVLFLADGAGKEQLTSRVMAEAGFPAASAGVRDGDRVVSVDGRSVEYFSELAEARATPGPKRLLLDRDGAQVSVEVTPNAEGLLGLKPAGEKRAEPLGRVIVSSLGAPIATLAAIGRVASQIGTTRTVGGPIVLQRPPPSAWLRAVAMSGAAAWPVAVGFSALLTGVIFLRRARQPQGSGPPAR